MSASSSSVTAWEAFWGDASDAEGEVFWDAPPDVTVEPQLKLFADHFDIGLPLVDLGCGNGTQTRFLAGRYGLVRGVDLSAAAIEHARRADPAGAAGYAQLDGADPDAVRRLHDETGDANVYLRGVLHQCAEAERPALVAGIAALTGRRGRVFAVELAEAAKAVLMRLATAPGGPPPKLRPVLGHGITPGEVTDAALPGLFRDAGLEVLAAGDTPLVTTEYEADGSRLELPSKWLVAGRTEDV